MDSSHHHHHVVLFPFMSKGHTIPILGLARLLLRRPYVSVTVFTTSANRPFVSKFLSDMQASIIDLPFPQNIPDIPPGVESTDKLPSMSLYPVFCRATSRMQPDFEQALQTLPRVNFMVSDMFLWWTLESADKFGYPRFVFSGMSTYVDSVCRDVFANRLLFGPNIKSDDDSIILSKFPWIKVTRNDFDPPFTDPEPKGPEFELAMDQVIAATKSYGRIVNSFYELESKFVDDLNGEEGARARCVGPLNLAENSRVELEPQEPYQKPIWIQWLDQKLEQGRPVLYVAFGTQAEISAEQLQEIAKGLEASEVNFLWVIRMKEIELGDGFEERVKERGLVVRDWVDQREILNHQSVQGFLSHCGWNSVMESICASVPILAWPLMAEQPLNARMVEEEIKVGLKVERCNGSVRGFVKSEGLEKSVKELMKGERGNEARKKVKELGAMAMAALEEGSGSSWTMLQRLIDETCNCADDKKTRK